METFVLHNVSHHPRTRAIRAAAPAAVRHKQFVLKTQRRLIPNKPIELDREELVDNLEQLLDLEKQGIIELRTKAGELVDLRTFDVKPNLPHPPAPKFRLDDAHNDPPRGKNVQFTPDNTEEIKVKSGQHSGGGMTPEAVEASKNQDLPPLPEELKHLEEEEEHPLDVSAQPTDGPTEEELVHAFGNEPEDEEADIEHTERPQETEKPKKRRR